MKKLELNKIYQGDSLEVLKTFPDESIDMCVTSPPYWGLRDYGEEKQIGMEDTPEEFIDNLCDIFDEVYRVLKPEGSCWVNLGDSYVNHKGAYTSRGQAINKRTSRDEPKYGKKLCMSSHPFYKDKSLAMVPSRFAVEMMRRDWILRNEIIWYKSSCMPASVKDRYTVDFEKLFFFTKKKKYYFKQQLEPLVTPYELLVKDKRGKGWEGKGAGGSKLVNSVANHGGNKSMGETMNPDGRNKRTVWNINPKGFKDAHFAVYPPELIESPIDAGCPDDGVVLDPFMGSGTTAEVAMKQGKNWVGIDLNPEYIKIADKRLKPTIVEKKTKEKSSEFWG